MALVVMTFMFSSCMVPPEPPIGVWKSEDPSLVFYLDPAYRSLILPGSYLGFYTIDGEKTKVVITLDTRSRAVTFDGIRRGWPLGASVFEATENLFDPDLSNGRRNYFFRGATLRVKDDQMHFSYLMRDDNDDWIEVETVFDRHEDYDPIDPEEWFPTPRGVWESEEPNIVLYVDPAYQSSTETRLSRFLGVYIHNGEEIKITGTFGDLMRWLHITTAPVVDENNRQVFNGAERMRGDLKMQGDQLHFELDLESQEETGFATIIFDRVTAYDSIVPEDWGH